MRTLGRFDRETMPRQALSLAQLCFVAPVEEGLPAQVRQGQVDALVRLAPLTMLVNVAASLLLAACLWRTMPHTELVLWTGSIASLCAVRLLRIVRLRRDPGYAARRPPTVRTILPPIVLLSFIWVLPTLLWFGQAGAVDKIIMVLVLYGMASGASVTLSTVPPAAFTFIGSVTVTGLISMAPLDPVIMPVLLPLFAVLLSYAVLWNARQFAGHLASRLQTREKAELINLLREFDASGSEWLWKLDGDLNVAHMSEDMIRAMDQTASKVLGRNVFNLLDPSDRIADVSASMRAVIDSFVEQRTFRDLAIPVRGGRAWWSLSGKPLLDAHGKLLGWRGVGSDITALRLKGEDSVTLARHDPMTGIGNRLLIRELLEEALLRRRSGRGGCALMLVDLDRFKLVNDTLGHEVGDELLCEVARRLQEVAPDRQVGRLGGDEFALVVTDRDSREELAALAEEVIARLSSAYRVGQSDLNIGATIGIATAPDDGATQEALTRCADLALYSAKKAGRGGYHFFAAWMAEQAAANRALESDLRSALAGGELSLAYQPVVDARGRQVIAREALLRWNHPTRGEVPPDLFVPVIEDAGLIGHVGNWVLREACREAVCWDDGARVAVNVSSAQLAAGPVLVGHVIHALAASGLDAGRLELEVTESLFLASDATTKATLEQLRAIGVRLVLDDFGMGYASFSCLTNGEFSKIKIDRSFTVAAAAPGKPAELAIVESILTLARGLSLEVTAEGIETPEQAALMVTLGCGQLQGYLFGRPLAPERSGEGSSDVVQAFNPRAA